MAQSPSRDSQMDGTWVTLAHPGSHRQAESLPDRVRRVEADLNDINTFYSISISPARHERLQRFYADEARSLLRLDFDALGQQGKVDFILLRKYLQRNTLQLRAEQDGFVHLKPLLPFGDIIITLCEKRERVEPMDAERTAQQLDDINTMVGRVQRDVEQDKIKMGKTNAFKASNIIDELRGHLAEFFAFYASYDPSFDYWATVPYRTADGALGRLVPLIQTRLAGVRPGGAGDIIGEPIGREALLRELEAEVVAYSPEELVRIARDQFSWSEGQMRRASRELGYGDDWKRAMDQDVKTSSVPPGEQPGLVLELAREGARFVGEHDLVTVPEVAETYRATMMSAQQQQTAPFFLGGPSILIAYPTAGMAHQLKTMVMRGNNRYFARATAFHELIPGHRLQLFMLERHRNYRRLFTTPFFVEGWATYWELLFWQRGDFFVSPRDRIGHLFWRMHRCARILLTVGFHLGQTTPQECIDFLVESVNHERHTAEAEVRRWLSGQYGPLYQMAYMVGALQLLALRSEAVDSGRWTEKQFNDQVLTLGAIPNELVRALVLDKELEPDYKASWKFYKL
ncbi:X-Pro dipeptidyl-peptidase [Hirsutella rhossiliensis]|uniref:X-Pro dipeptidyl-peptidase n=1 Tax=Hirsutella rhossiliensis TaxID=111463 RepID=A0A9P8MNI6_9HYPO|nr:X-Pro dipeptidyl-peptidase [Hirsutella rhossiliensis]KAH0958269.1 X-Pro dipeptidyl-peptidase [Hirsutella rhossiliensis]